MPKSRHQYLKTAIIMVPLLVASLPVFTAETTVLHTNNVDRSNPKTLLASTFSDKLRGAWVGELVGNFSGLPTENKFVSDPNPAQSVPWVFQNPWVTDDDTSTEWVFLHMMEQYGFDSITYAQMVPEWQDHFFQTSDPSLWCANLAALNLMKQGYVPPATGSSANNSFWNAIDAQIETELFGEMAPGMPVNARGRADYWARVMNDKQAVDTASFYAAMITDAYFTSNSLDLINNTKGLYPSNSRVYQIVTDVQAWHSQYSNWRDTRKKIYDKYWGTPPYNGGWSDNVVGAELNFASNIMAVLYGNSNFETTIQIALMTGFDNDCNAATAGVIVGTMVGYSNIPENIKTQCSDRYKNTNRRNLPAEDTVTNIVSRIQTLAEKNILARGGQVSGNGSDKTYTIYDGDFVVPVDDELAKGKPTRASSLESTTYPATNATDGVPATRWASAFSDPQWISVDLGALYSINQVDLVWEAAFAKSYQIQVSTDNVNWTTVYSTSNGNGGFESPPVSGTGRYVRMYGTQRATAYGYSLWEFRIYGTPATHLLSVSPTTLSLPVASSSNTVAVTSDVAWSVSSNQAWLSVSPSSGLGNGTFSANVTANSSSSSRGAVLTLSGPEGSGLSRTVTVNQAGQNIYSVKIEAESYREMLGVKTQQCSDTGGGLNVGWIDPGDWMIYPITLPGTGSYTIQYRVASPNSGKSLSADLNAGSIPLGSVDIPNTGDWQKWTTVTQTVTMNAGPTDFGINAGTGGWNLNWFTITYNGGPIAPTITAQPVSQNVREGQSATFGVNATGTDALTYQWYRANPGSAVFSVLSGATSSTYKTPAVTMVADNGARYCVRVTDTSNTLYIDSSAATLYVNDVDARADELVRQMTQDEKLKFVHGISDSLDGLPRGAVGYIDGISRLNIPNLYLVDGSVGVGNNTGESTALPSAMASAAAWDLDLAYKYGEVIGKDMRSHGVNINLGGNVNLIGREPRNGRAFETKGEDPILAGKINAAHIQATQDQKVVACIKHFAFNDQETNRDMANFLIDERSARETDLLAYEIGIKDTNVQSVMAGYNLFRGDWCAENDYLLNTILKGEWGFKGFVMSDWWGTHSCGKAAKGGLDMEMPGFRNFGALGSAVQSGEVPQSRLNDMVHRTLRALIASGVVDDPPTPGPLDSDANLAVAQKVAEQGSVLLKNAQGQLPLNPASIRSLAVIGPHADHYVISGGGSARVNPIGRGELQEANPPVPGWAGLVWLPSSPKQCIEAKLSGVTVQYDDGTDPTRAANLARNVDVAIVFAPQWSSEAMDPPSLNMKDVSHASPQYDMNALITAVSNQNAHTIVVLESSSAQAMPWIDKVTAVLAAWYPGQKGAEAIANILFGQVNPSGKLPITFPKSDADLPYPTILSGGSPFPVDYGTVGLKVGYKWYDAQNITPLFPFGFGLSYTTFSISGSTKVWSNNQLTVDFDITNTGSLEGAEVAQVYLSMPPNLNEPPKRLIAWKKVNLASGASTHVSLVVNGVSSAHPFSYWDTASRAWVTGSGDYEVFLGNSSRHLSSLGTFHVAP